jgi:UDPglucose--hexose-1-phosphate uridylyltransferase
MRDHNTDLASVTSEEAVGVFQAFRERYQTMLQEDCISYVSMFHNWGASAGASLYHPHFQIISIPVIPPDIQHSLVGSHEYFKNHGKCGHCALVEWELKEGKRIIVENEHAIAITPFTSRTNFEIRVFPKRHLPYFEETPQSEIASVVHVLHQALGLMKKTLNDPDYNFFIHTSPIKDKEKYEHYHWHIEVVPKTNIDAGFELGTGIDIISVNPDDAAIMYKNNRT